MDEAQIKEMVRARYGGIAASSGAGCCEPAPSSCCGPEASRPSSKCSMLQRWSKYLPSGHQPAAGSQTGALSSPRPQQFLVR